MAYHIFEILNYTPEEKKAAEKLPLDSPERKTMMERKFAALEAERLRRKNE
jgi:hypothetical protein